MSISHSLQASARSAYRSLFRAASRTFAGDERVLNAFLDKTRSEYREGRSLTDKKRYEERIKLAQEVALVLRKNTIQGRKQPGEDVYKLQITNETELGDNESARSSIGTTSKSRSGLPEDHTLSQSNNESPKRLNFSELKRRHREREVPTLNEKDLDEAFVRGSGPGGQSVNKTENCVHILHKPSGIRVSCQATRSLEANRRIARKLLVEKLDKLQNPGLSREDLKRARMNERERRRRKKRKKKGKKSDFAVEEGS